MQPHRDAGSSFRLIRVCRICPFQELQKYRLHQKTLLLPEGLRPVRCKHGYRLLPFRFLRGNCFDLIKGKKTPSSFKFIFSLSPENLHNTIEAASGSFTTNDVNGIFFNIRYQNEQLLLTTGVSYNIFSTDKTLENSWDAMMRKFLVNNDISFEEL